MCVLCVSWAWRAGVAIKFYGNFDKPLGRYFREDLFNQVSRCHPIFYLFTSSQALTLYYLIKMFGLCCQTSCCESCKEPAESHVRCYTHQQGSLTISVRNLASVRLPGENDGKIWMWHRCLRCKLKDGIPLATQRVVMSDAARGLSFGKFLELSFSNRATANRIACCGHSLQRDCLRFYGYVISSCGKIFRFKANVNVSILHQQVWKHGCCLPLFSCRHSVCQLAGLNIGLCLSSSSRLGHQRGC